ncbi:Polysaccharide deacetylase [Candidatus Electrothrix aarhusensis]
MNIKTKAHQALLAFFVFLTGASYCGATEHQEESNNIPWYFIAIHSEPYNHEWNHYFTERAYGNLTKMIAQADAYHIKLTLMFAPAWVDFLLSDKERVAAVERWKKNGHEIAGHHHSVWHGNWDGYSSLSRQEAEAWRVKVGGHDYESCYGSESYYGTLTDFTTKLQRLDPAVKSGCMNDEISRSALPDAIIYNTCSGFANYGEVGRVERDPKPEKGKNEYVSVGTYNGIERKWLTHHFLLEANAAKKVFSTMHSGVYGTVNHSSPRELQTFLEYLEFLHQVDPQGEKSRTMSEIIEQKLLPEKQLSTAQINAFYPPPQRSPVTLAPEDCPHVKGQKKL